MKLRMMFLWLCITQGCFCMEDQGPVPNAEMPLEQSSIQSLFFRRKEEFDRLVHGDDYAVKVYENFVDSVIHARVKKLFSIKDVEMIVLAIFFAAPHYALYDQPHREPRIIALLREAYQTLEKTIIDLEQNRYLSCQLELTTIIITCLIYDLIKSNHTNHEQISHLFGNHVAARCTMRLKEESLYRSIFKIATT